MRFYLLTGTPGQSKGSAAKKMADHLRKKGLKVGIGNVEDKLLDLFPEFNKSDSAAQESLVSLIGHKTQTEIKDRWPDAFRAAVAEASVAKSAKNKPITVKVEAKASVKGAKNKLVTVKPDVAIVVCCLQYYSYRTYEFYSPVDFNVVADSKVSAAMTLIDDIYDIYYRLSQPGQVFDIQALVERNFPVGSDKRDSEDLRRLYKDSLNIAVGSLLRVLVWREKEIACGANLARMLPCEHSVLASKHPVETGVRLLLGSTSGKYPKIGASSPVYVSHPISRPRRGGQNKDGWPPFVDDLEKVVTILGAKQAGAQSRVTPIMPTAIDEFRFLDDGKQLQPFLTPRWRLPEGNILYTRPTAPQNTRSFENYDDYERRGLSLIFDPPINNDGRRMGYPLSDSEVSGYLRTLRESIRLQMAGRDHLLVRQCPGFFLYRPVFGEYEFSGGVQSEMNTFYHKRMYADTIKKEGRMPCIAFIHDKSDVQGLSRGDEDNKKFPDVVRHVAMKVLENINKCEDLSNLRPKKPDQPEEAIIAKALQTVGCLDEVAREVYVDMIRPGKEGSIGADGEPLAWEIIKGTLVKTLETERAKAFSGDIGDKMQYTFSQNVPQWVYPKTADPAADTYIDVVEKLDGDEGKDNRQTAAIRARKFFAKWGSNSGNDATLTPDPSE